MCLQDEGKFKSLILQDKCNIRIFLSPETSVLNLRAFTVKCQQLRDKLSMNSLCMILVHVHLIALRMAKTLPVLAIPSAKR